MRAYNRGREGTVTRRSVLIGQFFLTLTVRGPPDGQHAFGPVSTSSQKTTRNITTNRRTFVQNLFPIASPPASGQSPFRSRCPCRTALTPFPCPSFSHKAIRLCGSPCGEWPTAFYVTVPCFLCPLWLRGSSIIPQHRFLSILDAAAPMEFCVLHGRCVLIGGFSGPVVPGVFSRRG